MSNLLKFLTTSWLLRGDFVIKTSWSISESVFDDFKNARKTFFGLSIAIAHRFSLDLMSPLERHIFMWSVFALVRCVKPQCVSNAITFYCKLFKVIKNGGKQDFASCWSTTSSTRNSLFQMSFLWNCFVETFRKTRESYIEKLVSAVMIRCAVMNMKPIILSAYCFC